MSISITAPITIPAAITITAPLTIGGAQGPAGAAATVAAGTTTTGSAGTSASVVNVGTSSAAVFNFTIPQGATGATGAAGPNAVTSATTSNGTANLAVNNLSTLGNITLPPQNDGFSHTANWQFTTVPPDDDLGGNPTYLLIAPYAAGTIAVTGSVLGIPDKLTDGTVAGTMTINSTTITYGIGAAAAHRTALGLGTLATQSGTFSGTSSGTNTGDQDLSNYLQLASTIEVTGTTPSFIDLLVYDGSLANGKRIWYTSDQELSWFAGVWTLTLNDGVSDVYVATKTSDSDRPWLLTSWTVTTGSGQPTFVIDLQTLQPIEGVTGTIAIVDDQEGRVAPTDMTGLGTGVATFLATPSSANLASAVSDETGSGSLVFATSPTLTTPTIAQINGGTAANDDITIQGTTNATRTTSYVILQPNGGNVGIGTTSPLTKFDVNGGSALYLNAFNIYGVSTTGVGAVFGKISNSNTAGRTTLAFSETPADAVSPAFIQRYGSTHATKPNAFEIGSSGSLELQANLTTRLFIATSGEVGMGTTSPNTKAALDITSTTKGFLPPRMTTTQRNAIATPPTGLVIYNTTTSNLNSYSGSAWVELVDSADLGANVATFLATPTSANLLAAVTDETGTGSLVFGTSPTLTTPTINSATIGTAATFNATTYTYGTGAATAHKAALDLFTLLTVVESDAGGFTANGGTAAASSDGDSLNLTTATANLRPNVSRFRNWSRNPGNSGAANFVIPVSLASAGNILHGGAAGNGASLRCGFGMVNGASAVAADANATTGKGFGWRMAWNVSTSRFEFNLWAHDGTTYVEGTGIDTGITKGNLDAFFNIIVRLASDGNNVALSVPSLTPTATLAGGPTSGTFANLGIPLWLAATHSTVAPSGAQSIIAKIINRKLLIG